MRVLSASRRGESLVEVIVASGVLMVVFTAVLMLIVQAVNLNISSQMRTGAISVAEKQLTQFITTGLTDSSDLTTRQDSAACLVSVPVGTNPGNIGQDGSPTVEPKCQNPTSAADVISVAGTGYCSYIELSKPTNAGGMDETYGGKISPATFTKAKVVVKWYTKGLGIEEYDLYRLVQVAQ